MRIFHISTGIVRIPADKLGSPEGHITSISKQMVKMGHEVTIVDRKYSSSDPSEERFDGVNIVRLLVKPIRPTALENNLPFLYWIRSVLNTITFSYRVSRYLKRSAFDIVNTYVISSTFTLIILNKRLRTKLIYNHHASFWPSRSGGVLSKFLSLLGNFTIRRIKRTIVQNDSVRAQFMERYGLPEHKIAVLPPGIDMTSFSLDTQGRDFQSEQQSKSVRHILFVGRINQMKGLEYLVMAADIIVNQKHYKEVQFLLVGPFESAEASKPGKYTARILGLIKALKLEDNVKLTGTVSLDELKKLYLNCDIFVLPSIVEQFPLVVLEAMAAGKPVVASKTAGAVMQIKDGWNGFLVEIGDEAGLADKLSFLLDNVQEAKRMGSNGREIAEQYDWSNIAPKYVEIYTG